MHERLYRDDGLLQEIFCCENCNGDLIYRFMELKGQVAIITGSTGQLGGQIAIDLSKAGCDCVCHYHSNKQRADEVVQQIQRAGRKAITVGADLTDAKQIETLFAKTLELGTPTILINSASVFKRTKLDEVTPK